MASSRSGASAPTPAPRLAPANRGIRVDGSRTVSGSRCPRLTTALVPAAGGASPEGTVNHAGRNTCSFRSDRRTWSAPGALALTGDDPATGASNGCVTTTFKGSRGKSTTFLTYGPFSRAATPACITRLKGALGAGGVVSFGCMATRAATPAAACSPVAIRTVTGARLATPSCSGSSSGACFGTLGCGTVLSHRQVSTNTPALGPTGPGGPLADFPCRFILAVSPAVIRSDAIFKGSFPPRRMGGASVIIGRVNGITRNISRWIKECIVGKTEMYTVIPGIPVGS